MESHFSRHARRQMRWRKISEAEVNDTLTDPDKIEKSIKGRKNAFKHIGDKWLKVTFKEEDGAKIVVTVINQNE